MEAALLTLNAFLAVFIARAVLRTEKQPDLYKNLGFLAFKPSNGDDVSTAASRSNKKSA